MDRVISRAFAGERQARDFDKLEKYPQLSATSGQFVAATGSGLPPSSSKQCRATRAVCRRRALGVFLLADQIQSSPSGMARRITGFAGELS